MKVRIMVVDDYWLMRKTLEELLSSDPELVIVGEAENGETAVELAKQLKPDLIIMDIAMPIMNGIDATKSIRDHNPNIHIIGLSMHCNRYFMTSLLDAGADIVISKDSASEALLNVIYNVLGMNKAEEVKSVYPGAYT